MEKKIMIINGPNLNLLGKREVDTYGSRNFEDYFEGLKMKFNTLQLKYFQSNHEGGLVEKIQQVGYEYNGIILNAAAYTHTSIAIADAIAAVTAPVIEVHISNIFARESFRSKSFISKHCVGIISGLGLSGYQLALNYFLVND